MDKTAKRKAFAALFKNFKKRKATPSVAKQATKKEIEKVVQNQAEFKESHTASGSNATVSTTTGTIQCLNNNIAQGDDVTNRNGRVIHTKYIDIIYTYLSQNTGGEQIALVYDRQPDGTTPAYNTIFDAGQVNGGMAFKDTADNKERFTVYWIDNLPDETCTAVGNATGHLVRKRHFIKPKDIIDKNAMVTRYGTTGASTPTVGAWYLCWADEVNTTTNASIRYNAKYVFTDI